jgi:hypothetical protein
LCANFAHKVSRFHPASSNSIFRFLSPLVIFLFLQCLPAIGGRRLIGL